MILENFNYQRLICSVFISIKYVLLYLRVLKTGNSINQNIQLTRSFCLIATSVYSVTLGSSSGIHSSESLDLAWWVRYEQWCHLWPRVSVFRHQLSWLHWQVHGTASNRHRDEHVMFTQQLCEVDIIIDPLLTIKNWGTNSELAQDTLLVVSGLEFEPWRQSSLLPIKRRCPLHSCGTRGLSTHSLSYHILPPLEYCFQADSRWRTELWDHTELAEQTACSYFSQQILGVVEWRSGWQSLCLAMLASVTVVYLSQLQWYFVHAVWITWSVARVLHTAIKIIFMTKYFSILLLCNC